jgi:site-specific recombinase XerD
MPRRKLGSGHLCRRVEEWPEADQAAWRKAVQEADPFAANTPAASWSERSRLKTARGYGRFLAWRSEKGLDPEQAPGDRVTAPVVKTYIADLARINGDFTVLCRVQELCDAIRVIAPDRDWGWLRQIQNTLRARSVSVRDKRARMQPAGELVKLGKALMRKAETATTRPSLTRAVWFRDGLMIALLAYRPLRLSNLAAITLGRHLIHQSRGYRLYFSADEVKGGQPIDTAVPASLVADIDRYLDHYRPILLTRGGRQSLAVCDALWVSNIATALDPNSIPNRIKKHTRAAFGKHLWVHLFRDCAATTIAIDDPRHARSIMNILGHSTLATSEKHYNQARSLEASRRYQKVIADLRRCFEENGF